MAWLQGSSTWATIDTDITKLLTGNMNDGVGANAGADAWQYDLSGSAYNTIRTQSSMDVSLPAMSNRAGYWALTTCGGNSVDATSSPGATPFLTSCVTTAPITSTSGYSHGRALIIIGITTANTVPGNYSTARFSWWAYDVDNGSLTQVNFSTNNSLTAAGIGSIFNGLQVQITDPSGTLPYTNMYFVRGFTGTYTYGIDAWPWYPNRTAAPTFTTAPPGTAGTDYDLVDQAPMCEAPNTGSTAYLQNGIPTHGGWFAGLGIKTATGLGSGARYTTNVVTVASQKIAIVKSQLTAGGSLDLIFGPAPPDLVNPSSYGGGIRPSHCFAVGDWCRFAQTPASVTTAMGIQYWINVKPNGFSIVLNADPGFTGKMGCGGVWQLDNVTDPTYDIRPWVTTHANMFMQAGSSSASTQYQTVAWAFRSYWGERRRRDSSWGTRDWQTGHMRTDFCNGPYSNTAPYMWTGCPLNPLAGFVQPNATASSAAPGIGSYIPANSTVYHPGSLNTWDLYGFQLAEGAPGAIGQSTGLSVFPNNFINGFTSGQGALQQEQTGVIRGSLSTFAFVMTVGGWGNGDEITDSVNGNKYFLIIPDYAGIPGRMIVGSAAYQGGVAIRENQ